MDAPCSGDRDAVTTLLMPSSGGKQATHDDPAENKMMGRNKVADDRGHRDDEDDSDDGGKNKDGDDKNNHAHDNNNNNNSGLGEGGKRAKAGHQRDDSVSVVDAVKTGTRTNKMATGDPLDRATSREDAAKKALCSSSSSSSSSLSSYPLAAGGGDAIASDDAAPASDCVHAHRLSSQLDDEKEKEKEEEKEKDEEEEKEKRFRYPKRDRSRCFRVFHLFVSMFFFARWRCNRCFRLRLSGQWIARVHDHGSRVHSTNRSARASFHKLSLKQYLNTYEYFKRTKSRILSLTKIRTNPAMVFFFSMSSDGTQAMPSLSLLCCERCYSLINFHYTNFSTRLFSSRSCFDVIVKKLEDTATTACHSHVTRHSTRNIHLMPQKRKKTIAQHFTSRAWLKKVTY